MWTETALVVGGIEQQGGILVAFCNHSSHFYWPWSDTVLIGFQHKSHSLHSVQKSIKSRSGANVSSLSNPYCQHYIITLSIPAWLALCFTQTADIITLLALVKLWKYIFVDFLSLSLHWEGVSSRPLWTTTNTHSKLVLAQIWLRSCIPHGMMAFGRPPPVLGHKP